MYTQKRSALSVLFSLISLLIFAGCASTINDAPRNDEPSASEDSTMAEESTGESTEVEPLAEGTTPSVAVITPYLAQPGTQFYVEGFEAAAGEKGWELNVIDTAGDVAAVISRIEDVVNQGVDAIVINVDPAQVAAGLAVAADAEIPVFGMDSGTDPLLVTNVTSNGYAMAAETATYVANRINGEGGVVMFVFDPFPPVQIRGVVADAIFANYPDIEVVDRITPDVKSMPIPRRWMPFLLVGILKHRLPKILSGSVPPRRRWSNAALTVKPSSRAWSMCQQALSPQLVLVTMETRKPPVMLMAVAARLQ